MIGDVLDSGRMISRITSVETSLVPIRVTAWDKPGTTETALLRPDSSRDHVPTLLNTTFHSLIVASPITPPEV